jgi:hypothetical protein
MDKGDQAVWALFWEWRMMKRDPHHPINNRQHPKHAVAVAAMKLLEEEGRRLLEGSMDHRGASARSRPGATEAE